MSTQTDEAIYMPPIERMDNDALTSIALSLSLGLGFLLMSLPDVFFVALVVYGFWGMVNLIGEFNNRRRIAREIREFRRSLDEDEPVV